jgi:hypothetical protein
VNASSHAAEMDFGIFLDIFGFGGDGNSEASMGQLFETFDIQRQGSFGPVEF